jgi:uncharacterized protein (DUF2147 family)
MRKLYFAAATALLLATTSAQAGSGISFQIDGQRVRVESPRGCNSLSCITITAPGYKGKLGNIDLNGFGGSKDKDDDVSPPSTTTTTAPATTAPVAAAPVAPVAAAPAAPAAPAQSYVAPPPPVQSAIAPAPVNNDVTPAPAPAPVAAAPAPAPVAAAPAPVAAAPVVAANSPIGVWATEENKGNVRIEQCGANLCGYAVKTNERILINMKPSETKWVGRIHDPDSGRNYDSTIAMRGPNALRVQGCAFGGMFCGGQTWKRIS